MHMLVFGLTFVVIIFRAVTVIVCIIVVIIRGFLAADILTT